MELFKILGTIAINNMDAIKKLQDSTNEASKVHSALEKIGTVSLKVGKAMAVAVGAGATALSALTKHALDSYAQYEQLVGGVETLFGTGGMELSEYAKSVGKTIEEVEDEYNNLMMAQDKVLKDASEAYNTAGMSANQYMETVTGFSASLIQSLEGDTLRAAELSNQAIKDMSDNANKMGTDMSMIQNAYQGFAKQNYMMLDNLKLGYGGTKTEMERLLEDAEKLQAKQGNMVDYSIDSYADIINAIHDVQTEMGITGTTAEEAEKTISGSLSAMKASWSNLVTGFGNDQADLTKLINQFVDKASVAFRNILPRIEQILKGIAELVKQIVPQITEMLPFLIEEILPPLLEATASLIQGLADAIPDLLDILLEVLPEFIKLGVEIVDSILEGILNNIGKMGTSATQIIVQLVTGIVELLPKLLEIGIKLIVSIIQGITQSLPQIISTITNVALQLVDVLIQNLPLFLDAGLQFIVSLTEGLLVALPDLLSKLPEIVQQITSTLLDNIGLIINTGVVLLTSLVDNLPIIIDTIIAVLPQIITSIIDALTSEDGIAKVAEAGVTLLTAIISNLGTILVEVIAAIPIIIDAVKTAFTNSDALEKMKEAGIDLIYAVLEGLKSAWDTVVDWAKGAANWLKDLFTIDMDIDVTAMARAEGQHGYTTSGRSNSQNSESSMRRGGTRSIGQYADGGVIPKGQIAFLEGYGAEAVVPLEKTAWINKVAENMDSALGGNGTADKLDKLITLQEQMLAIMPELANISIKLSNREVGRVVRQVSV